MTAPDTNSPVYVVDDSAQMRASLQDAVQRFGHQVVTFESGPRALEAIARVTPKLMLIDLRMLPMAGDELCRKIKENRALSKIPVIIFTSAESAHEVMRSWRAGADDFLPKPILPWQLQQKLKSLEQASAAENEPQRLHRPGEQRRLLFVDDSRFFRTVLGGSLEQSGFQLLYARSGTEALELAEAHGAALDAVICDLVMPGMDGLAFIAALRGKEGWEHKPVLMMSSTEVDSARQEQVEQATGAKMLDKRVLPVEAIVARVNAALRDEANALRATERVPFFSVAEFRGAGATEFLSGFSYDVSPGGVFVRSLTPLAAGTAVELRVKLTIRLPVPLCYGEVVWANQFGTRTSFSYPVGMGIRFTHLEPDQRAEVQKLVKAGGRLIAA